MNSQSEEKNPCLNTDNYNGIIADLRCLIDDIDSNFKKAKDLILELAQRLDVERPSERIHVCRWIKNILKDKITEGKITEKWIEECLPPEYKRRYTKSEVSSLSKQAQRNAEEKKLKNKNIIAVDAQSGNSVFNKY